MTASFVTMNKVDLKAVETMLRGINDGATTVMVRAINITLTGVKTDITQEVYNVLNVTKTRIRKDLKDEKASKFDLSAKVSSTGEPIGLYSFTGTGQTKKGTSVKVKRLGTRKIIPHAFVKTIKNATNVWRRKKGQWAKVRTSRWRSKPTWTQIGGSGRAGRFPIERLTGPRAQDMLAEHGAAGGDIIYTVILKADERLRKALHHETDYLLSKL